MNADKKKKKHKEGDKDEKKRLLKEAKKFLKEKLKSGDPEVRRSTSLFFAFIALLKYACKGYNRDNGLCKQASHSYSFGPGASSVRAAQRMGAWDGCSCALCTPAGFNMGSDAGPV